MNTDQNEQTYLFTNRLNVNGTIVTGSNQATSYSYLTLLSAGANSDTLCASFYSDSSQFTERTVIITGSNITGFTNIRIQMYNSIDGTGTLLSQITSTLQPTSTPQAYVLSPLSIFSTNAFSIKILLTASTGIIQPLNIYLTLT